MSKKRVLVAMSGGVDSSVAAALLLEQGYEVIGATMQLLPDKALSGEAIASARNVAQKLAIEHHSFDMSKLFKDKVIDQFINEYACGYTPNPCVNCNEHLKFGALLGETEKLGCQYIATGHYARIQQKNAATYIQKAANAKKDQSYFLYRLKQATLTKIIFPLGNIKSKDEVRKLAQKFGLPVVDRPDSQDVCFIPDNDSKAFLAGHKPEIKQKGNIILAGTQEILGEHEGVAFYTIGQRKGLGIAYKDPLYVIDINAETNTVTVSTNENIFGDLVWAKNLSFAFDKPKTGEELTLKAKIRYAHKEEPANITILDKDTVKIAFFNKQRAITPGQSIVFYDDDLVIGGGIIYKSGNKP